MLKFPDHTHCTITVQYKSGASHIHNLEISKARLIANKAIAKRAVRFVKVIVPDPESRRIAVFLWTYETEWTRTDCLAPV